MTRRLRRLVPSMMFSATVKTGMSMKCWCTIPIPRVDRVLRRLERDGLAVHQDLALVGLVEPVEDVHQGRLAGAVLAEQGVHLARPQVEVDVVVGDDSRKALRDPAKLEDGGLFHRGDSMLRAERRRKRPRGGRMARPRG